MSDSYPALIELISRLEGADKKTCETALYCLNAADRRDKRLRSKTEAVVAENVRLRAALKPFADIAAQFDFADDNEGISGGLLGDLRAAAAAIRETGDG